MLLKLDGFDNDSFDSFHTIHTAGFPESDVVFPRKRKKKLMLSSRKYHEKIPKKITVS